METKHTPGPWSYHCDEQGFLVTAITGMKKQLPICEVSRGCFTSEAEANARLIAAAPNMLAALRAIVARINGVWDDPDLVAYGNLFYDSKVDIEAIASKGLAMPT